MIRAFRSFPGQGDSGRDYRPVTFHAIKPHPASVPAARNQDLHRNFSRKDWKMLPACRAGENRVLFPDGMGVKMRARECDDILICRNPDIAS